MELSPKIKNRICILPDSVKRKIAAGEVIDAPYSVVKELLENAIDAQASYIEIEIEESGLKRIAISDNGVGIVKDDLPLAVEEHATSKIRDINDIFAIQTMGFRGEALASIAEVSQLTILSRTHDEPMGGKLVVTDNTTQMLDWAGATGTTVIVENLFYNTPARKKFLKSIKRELNRIKDTIFCIAVVHPEIKFKIVIDKKMSFVFEPVDIKQRIQQIYGNEIALNLIDGSLQDLECTITGYISKPEYYRSNRSLQFLYVNKRPVQFPYFSFILQQAYQAILQKGQYPVAFICMNVKPDLIDVNVHPAKREIRFFDNNYIHSMLYNFANKIISGGIHTIAIGDHERHYAASTTHHDISDTNDNEMVYEVTLPLQYRESENKNAFLKEIRTVYTQIQGKDYAVLGVIFGEFIVIQKLDELYFIDFHAAHERKLYDYLLQVNTTVAVQQLLIPVVIEFAPDMVMLVNSYHDLLIGYGLLLEQFDDNSVVVNAIPDFCTTSDIEGLIKDVVDSLYENKNHIDNIKMTIIEKIACHAAKRANDSMTSADIISITDYVFTCSDYRCPHGRPFVYKLSKSELEGYFKRL